jgi:hypothetical protein
VVVGTVAGAEVLDTGAGAVVALEDPDVTWGTVDGVDGAMDVSG